MPDGAFWKRLFAAQGLIAKDGTLDLSKVEDAGVAIVGFKEAYIGLKYVIAMSDDFLVFQYTYRAPAFRMPWDTDAESGDTRLWVPWESIAMVYVNTDGAAV